MHRNNWYYFWEPKPFLPGFIFFVAACFFLGCQDQDDLYQPRSKNTSDILDRSSNLLNSGQYQKSLRFLDSAYQQMEQKTPIDLWEKYNFLSRIYLNYDIDLERSKTYLDSMFWILEDRNQLYKKEYANTKFLEGDWYKAKKQFDNAFASYFEGREFALTNLSSCLISEFTYQLGMFRYGQMQFTESIPYFKQAIQENQDCSDGDMIVQELYFPQRYRNTLALAYEKTGELDSAVFHYRDGLRFLSEAEKKFPEEQNFIRLAQGIFMGNLGGVLAKLEQYEEAENLLLKSIAINSRPDFDTQDALTAKIKLADLYIARNQLDAAQRLMNELERALSQLELKNRSYIQTLIRWNEVQSSYFEQAGAPDKAYPFLKAYYLLKDSVDVADNELRAVDMEASYDNAAQQYQLSIINRDNHIKNIYLGATIGFTILLVIFLGLVGKGLKRSKKINKVISQQNIEMQDTLSALEQSQAENTKIMSMVAHDLRNPISSMVMMSDILLADEQITGENRVLLEHIKTSCTNSINLVSEMMQPNKNTELLAKETVDLDRLLSYCVELLQHKAHEKQQKLILTTIPVTAFVSREKLWRVISNLIGNAIKFSPRGKSIHINLLKKANKAIFSIKDEGIGIPESIRDKVFEWYTDGKRSGTEGEKPFGMGLAISKQIVSAHGGTISFETEEDNGTTFFVEIPIKHKERIS